MFLLALVSAITMTLGSSDVTNLSAHNRQVQAEAVQRLASEGVATDERLFRLWLETDRFDVRQHILRVYETRGVSGIP